MGTNKMDFEGSGHGLASGLKYIQNFIRKMWNNSRIKKAFWRLTILTRNTLVRGFEKHKFVPPFISHVIFFSRTTNTLISLLAKLILARSPLGLRAKIVIKYFMRDHI